MISTQRISLSTFVLAPAPELWTALTDSKIRSSWWGDGIVIEPKVGGRFEEPWTNDAGELIVTTGKVLAYDPEERLRLSWKDPDWPAETEVEITLSPSPEGTELTLVHRGWENLVGLDQDELIEDHRSGWAYLLDRLSETVHRNN